MNGRKKDWFAALSLILGILLLCGILVITVSSLKTTGAGYTSLKGADLSRELESELAYDDHMFASIGFGILILPYETGKEARLASFLFSSVREIELRILACGLLYSMMVSAVLQYFAAVRIRRHFPGVLIVSLAPFAVFAAAVLIAQRAFGLPAVFPDGHECFLLAVGLLSVTAGNCALSAVLSAVRLRKLAAILAVPAVLFLFIVGMNLECGLYTSPTLESFAYFNETHADALADDYAGECYYDEEKNAIILDGAEYPPETVDNPRYLTGWKRLCAFLFELADAYAGNGLLLAGSVVGAIPLRTAAVYLLKAAAWIALACGFRKRRRNPDRAD